MIKQLYVRLRHYANLTLIQNLVRFFRTRIQQERPICSRNETWTTFRRTFCKYARHQRVTARYWSCTDWEFAEHLNLDSYNRNNWRYSSTRTQSSAAPNRVQYKTNQCCPNNYSKQFVLKRRSVWYVTSHKQMLIYWQKTSHKPW